MKKRNPKYVIPSDALEKANGGPVADMQQLKRKDGEEFNIRQVGALFGSSIEFNVTANVTVSPAGECLCPVHKEVLDGLRPKRQFGQFAAWKDSEAQVMSETSIGRSVAELATEEEIEFVANRFERFKVEEIVDLFSYYDLQGNKLSYMEMMEWHIKNRKANEEIQAEKDNLIKEYGCSRTFRNGKWVSPEYPNELLEKLKECNSRLKSPTGVFVNVSLNGIHTIAKDSHFFGGSLDQSELDALAAKLRYKEHRSFYSGKIRVRSLPIPIQTKQQLLDVFRIIKDRRLWTFTDEKGINIETFQLMKDTQD